MKFNGALVKVNDDLTIGLAVVEKGFLDLPMEERIRRMKMYKAAFDPSFPLCLLIEAPTEHDREEYWGRPDLTEALKEIPLNMMTFRTYEGPDDVE